MSPATRKVKRDTKPWRGGGRNTQPQRRIAAVLSQSRSPAGGRRTLSRRRAPLRERSGSKSARAPRLEADVCDILNFHLAPVNLLQLDLVPRVHLAVLPLEDDLRKMKATQGAGV